MWVRNVKWEREGRTQNNKKMISHSASQSPNIPRSLLRYVEVLRAMLMLFGGDQRQVGVRWWWGVVLYFQFRENENVGLMNEAPLTIVTTASHPAVVAGSVAVGEGLRMTAPVL